ncbi:hypothetical protein AAZX31_01G230200 [Glycine max]
MFISWSNLRKLKKKVLDVNKSTPACRKGPSFFCHKTIPSQPKCQHHHQHRARHPINAANLATISPSSPTKPPSNTTVTNQITNAPSARRTIISIDTDKFVSSPTASSAAFNANT